MSLPRLAITYPAAVLLAVAMLVLLGLSAVGRLPMQLFPNIEAPTMSIRASWRGASPEAVEADLVEPLERVLSGLPGLEQLEANASPGNTWINLRFAVGTPMEQTQIEVLSRLNRIPTWPAEAERPTIVGGAAGNDVNNNLTFFFVQLLPGTPGPIESHLRLIEDVVKPRLEAVPGVAAVDVNAGPPEDLVIRVDPVKAAQYQIPLSTVADLAARADDVSGGFVDVGRRQYTLRLAARYEPEKLEELILAWRDGRPVRLADIATVTIERPDRSNAAYQNGNPAISLRLVRSPGANVLSTLDEVQLVVADLREGVLAEAGLGIEQSFNAALFIRQALSLLGANLGAGIVLAIGVLWLFLRSRKATALIALTIPLSLLATVLVLSLLGRSLNVISLAGLAFAVGMTLDAAIVVTENILRWRQRGSSAAAAAIGAAEQVGGALLASTATTVAIFLPVLFLADVEGQMFADLALTISVAVGMSLLVALTVLPLASGKLLSLSGNSDRYAALWQRITATLMRCTDTPVRRRGVIGLLMGLPIALTAALMPPLDYLPDVKRAAVDAFLNVPPGTSVSTVEREVVPLIIERLQPYMDGEKEPQLRNYYVLLWPNGGTIGARVVDQSQIGELERIMREEVLVGLPDVRSNAAQGNLFGGFAGSSRALLVNMQSTDVPALYAAAADAQQRAEELLPGVQVQVWPGTELAEPQLTLIPDDARLLESGLDRRELGRVTRVVGDGLWLGEHFDGDRRLAVMLRSADWDNPEDLANTPLATPLGDVRRLGDLVSIERGTGPSSLRRIDGRRTVTLALVPPPSVALEPMIETVEEQLLPELRRNLPADASIRVSGSADSLARVVRELGGQFLLAAALLFGLLATLFRSLRDSLLVCLALPLATVGGVLALRLLDLFTPQPLDLLTMMGFIILLGLVVNNAILIVARARQAEREGAERDEAVAVSLRERLRPVFSSTLTSIAGMLPLVLSPAPGSEIYRGLGVVIVGGMSVSLVFTLLLLPALLRLGVAQRDAQNEPSRAEQPLSPSLPTLQTESSS